jgi:ADP-L-glycero-D-manno-heptose 6-epimerase
MPEGLRGQYQYFTEGPIDKLRGAGYTEEITDLEAGVEDYVRNHLNTDDPYL